MAGLIHNLPGVKRDLESLLTREESLEVMHKLTLVEGFSDAPLDRRAAILANLAYYKSELVMIRDKLRYTYNQSNSILNRRAYEEAAKVHSRPNADVVNFELSKPQYEEERTKVEKIHERLLQAEKYASFIEDTFWILQNTNKAIGAKNE